MSFYSELKRRNVFRVGAAYAVIAWLLIQIADTILPNFGFDERLFRILVIILAIGFIPTLIVTWIFELTPAGLQRDDDVDRSQASIAGSARRFDRFVMLVLVLAVSYFAVDKFILSESHERFIADTARQEGLSKALAEFKSNKSIAVLPFADMSQDQDQEYFADGITEQLRYELAQLEGLNVTGRTSSFAFKGHNQDLRSIGEQLGVDYILEGSVRKDEVELRITADLINAQSGISLRSLPFVRRADEIFNIQEEIARAVAGALSIALDVDGRNSLAGTGTKNVEAYNVFLQARAAKDFESAKLLYERALELDPEYAEAQAMLGAAYGAMLSWDLPPDEARDAQEFGRNLVVLALEMDPELAIAYGMLRGYQWARGDWVGATEYHEKYTALAPADIPARLGSANILGKTGRLREALTIDEMRRQLDPLNNRGEINQIEHFIQAGRYEDALAALAEHDRRYPPPNQGPDLRRLILAISQGEPEGIREALANYAVADPGVATIVGKILDEFDAAPTAVLSVMRQIYENDTELTGDGRLVIASMAAYYDDAEFALEIMSEELSVNMLRISRIWYPIFGGMRKLSGFKTLAENAGLVTYWRTYKWADSCRPLGDDDFECN